MNPQLLKARENGRDDLTAYEFGWIALLKWTFDIIYMCNPTKRSLKDEGPFLAVLSTRITSFSHDFTDQG